MMSRDHNKKQAKIKVLQKKAADRNKDEFYFNMVNTERVVRMLCRLSPASPLYPASLLSVLALFMVITVGCKLLFWLGANVGEFAEWLCY